MGAVITATTLPTKGRKVRPKMPATRLIMAILLFGGEV
jgi:hypothetical protein